MFVRLFAVLLVVCALFTGYLAAQALLAALAAV